MMLFPDGKAKRFSARGGSRPCAKGQGAHASAGRGSVVPLPADSNLTSAVGSGLAIDLDVIGYVQFHIQLGAAGLSALLDAHIHPFSQIAANRDAAKAFILFL